jgi:hypothetical protein
MIDLPRTINQASAAKFCILAATLGLSVALGLLAPTANAAQLSRPFNVTVNLQTVPPVPGSGSDSAFCRSTNAPGSFGATVTVVCATGAVVDIAPGRTGMPWSPMHGGAYRYLFQASLDGRPLGMVDSYVGVGTVTSWRVVNLMDWQYLEMLVNW